MNFYYQISDFTGMQQPFERPPQGLTMKNNFNLLRPRTVSMSSSNGSSGFGSHSTLSSSPKAQCTLVSSSELEMSGNIFHKRRDMSAFKLLPKIKRNGYYIKMADEGLYGADETRNFILTKLSHLGIRHLPCLLCAHDLVVYDKFPLIDGTFFLSPVAHNEERGIKVADRPHATEDKWLFAVCLGCLNSDYAVTCRGCSKNWNGENYVVGTMYLYDIFANRQCCVRKSTCKSCHAALTGPKYFSDFSKKFTCGACGAADYHFVKPIEEAFLINTQLYNPF